MSDTGNFNPEQEDQFDPNCPRFKAMRVGAPRAAVVVPGSYTLFPATITSDAKYTMLGVQFADGSAKNFPQA